MNNAIPISSALDEETARAEVYGLLAALFYAPPGAELLSQLRVAVTEAPAAGGFLEEPEHDGADHDEGCDFHLRILLTREGRAQDRRRF